MELHKEKKIAISAEKKKQTCQHWKHDDLDKQKSYREIGQGMSKLTFPPALRIIGFEKQAGAEALGKDKGD